MQRGTSDSPHLSKEPPYHEWRVADIERYIHERHTDPGLRIGDAAKRFGVNERTIRRDLNRDGKGSSWEDLVRRERMETAKRLLASSKSTIRVVARMSGYDSPTSFVAAFRLATGLSPVQWRVANRGPRRAGGPTGAARRPAQRAKALEIGTMPPSMHRPWGADEVEIWAAEMRDARTRLREEGRAGVSMSELTEEVTGPRGFGRSRRA